MSLLPHPRTGGVQILFLAGLTLIIGPQKTFYFFARKQKLRGTLCFIGGILLVFFKWPFVGVIVETIGFLNLFGCVQFVFLLCCGYVFVIPPSSSPMFSGCPPRTCSLSPTFIRHRPLVWGRKLKLTCGPLTGTSSPSS